MSDAITIRPMNRESVIQIAELEKCCFADPWSLNSLQAELLNPHAVYLTAMRGETVLGYVGMHHILDEGHITNVAVSPGCRRKGVGQLLIGALIDFAQAHDMSFLTLEVRASNQAAVALYAGFGFERAGLRRGYYLHPPEDAIIMTLIF